MSSEQGVVPSSDAADVGNVEVKVAEQVVDPPTKQTVDPPLKPQIENKELSWAEVALYTFLVLLCLYIFLIGLSLMGGSFKVLGGQGASGLFSAVDNPIAGLMVGILATVLVQSSSTSTSIVVTMTAADIISVRNGIPIIMGANIGTSVTNTIVSMGQSGDRIDLQRSFAGATVHDMFNMLTVATLLPIEAIIGAFQDDNGGGPLYWLSHSITESVRDNEGGDELFVSPIKQITKPIVSEILSSNKYVIYGLALGAPDVGQPENGHCGQCHNLAGNESGSAACTALAEEEDRRLESEEEEGEFYTRNLLSKRRLQENVDCSSYTCVGSSMKKYFKKIDKKGLKAMTNCDAFFPDSPCGSDTCLLEGAAFYDENIENGRLIKGGFLEGAGDAAGGIIGLLLSLFMLCLGLIGLTKSLQKIFMGQAKRAIYYSTTINDYIAMILGVGITIVVQSSSVTTSALTPLCGIGALPLNKMLPLTLGANIGTTCTALIASMVDMKPKAIQIALCHLFFNIIGILIWFPIPYMRQVPLMAAKTLGLYASYYKFVPIVYIFVAFVVIPGVFLGLSASYGAHVALGLILTLLVLAVLGVFLVWWNKGIPIGEPGAYRVLSLEQRKQGEEDLLVASAAAMGVEVEELRRKQQEPLSWFGQ